MRALRGCRALMGFGASPPPPAFLAMHTLIEPTAHLCVFSREPFSKTNTLRAASQSHRSAHFPDRALQPLCSPLASVDRSSFSAPSPLTPARLLIGGSCKISNHCSLGKASCCLLQREPLLCEGAEERVLCKLYFCVYVYLRVRRRRGRAANTLGRFLERRESLITFYNGAT